jgi:hypothetical protein
VLGHLGPDELVQRDAVTARGSERAAWPVRDLERALSLPPATREVLERRREAAHAVDEDRAIASTWSVRSTSGGPSVSSTAATLVPIASMAKTARPPSTSVKYFRSRGTSVDGV